MRETFEDYIQRLKDIGTKEGYGYTDETFELEFAYIWNCYKNNHSVYRCLEFLYYVEIPGFEVSLRKEYNKRVKDMENKNKLKKVARTK
jgi:hypothetical protein